MGKGAGASKGKGNHKSEVYLAGCGPESPDIGVVIVIVASVGLGVIEGQLDLRKHQVVGLVVGGVRAEHHLLDGVVLSGRLDTVGEPLHGEGGPLERVRDDEVVEERRVLLPDLVLLVDEALLHLGSELLLVSRAAAAARLRHLVGCRLGLGFRREGRVWVGGSEGEMAGGGAVGECC